MTNPRQVIRVIGDEPTPEDSDSILKSDRVLVEPKGTVFDMLSEDFQQFFLGNQAILSAKSILLGNKQVTSHSRMVHFESVKTNLARQSPLR